MSITAISHAVHEVSRMSEVTTSEICGVGWRSNADGLAEGVGSAKEVSKVDISQVKEAIQTWTDRVANVPAETLSFKGFREVSLVADRQVGPTCGYEMLENSIQLMINGKTGANNQLSTVMQKMVAQNPLEWGAVKIAYEGKFYWMLPFGKYPKMLGEFKIDSGLSRFSHEKLQRAVAENRPVIVCGDVGALPNYEQNGIHAVVITDWDAQKGVYTIVDSNFKGTTYQVDKSTLERFVNGHLPEELKNSACGTMVVINNRAAWDWSGAGGGVSFGKRISVSNFQKSIDKEVSRMAEERENLAKWVGRQLTRPIEDLRKEVRRAEIDLEIEKNHAHQMEILQDQSDLEIASMKGQTMDQYYAEKLGYKRVYPNRNGFNAGDPNLFTKDDKLYKLLPSAHLYQRFDTGYLADNSSAYVR